jgi:dienelactone hydrolase
MRAAEDGTARQRQRQRKGIVMRNRVRMTAAAAAVAVIATACAVVPRYEQSISTFEGFPVVSHVPPNPTGIVFLFHGTNGSAGIATKLEMVDMLNHLVARGYGFVATDSTNRTAKQWDNLSLSLTANPDLARLSRLHAALVAAGRITDETPIYAIGMSQGAGFASAFAQAFTNAGYPVAAIAPSHGPIPAAVRLSGGLQVPAFFALGANDPIVDNTQVARQVAVVAASGIPVELHVEPETLLRPVRYLRVPGVDTPTANAIFAAAVAAGLYDNAGHRLVSIAMIEAAFSNLSLPASLTVDQKRMLLDETEVVLAVHVYSATYATQTTDFFDAHRPPPS